MQAYRKDTVLQLTTYRLLDQQASGETQVCELVRTKTPQLLTFDRAISAADVAHAEAVYPLVQAAIRTGVYCPNRSSRLCSRRSCGFWRACEAEFGGEVPGAAAEA